jgi:hypothetical protein
MTSTSIYLMSNGSLIVEPECLTLLEEYWSLFEPGASTFHLPQNYFHNIHPNVISSYPSRSFKWPRPKRYHQQKGKLEVYENGRGQFYHRFRVSYTDAAHVYKIASFYDLTCYCKSNATMALQQG